MSQTSNTPKDNGPIISLIVAMAKNQVIGLDNKMPWHLPADLAHFKNTTLGHPIIMGRKTFQSIGFALPGRHNIVLTHAEDFQAKNVSVAHSVQQAIELAGDVDQIMVMGGATIYQQFLNIATRLYLTLIDLDVKGDTFFPAFNAEEWHSLEQQSFLADEKNPYNYQFLKLDKK